ncbi:hypothetical protein HHL11_20695 [Ramlibacter sp. G-1-2-2]|uniref:Uncharacterized protein n=1 Tax=Ramlibacter agri TaxID=2728837 RepID=A0A848H9J5_9BURK|nr:hypothetical protein [Ramlibacter agri]NML46179.1 hypothetical protein [Ramlibacter agri]
MNEIAQHFLATCAKGGEVDGGWLFAKALQQAQLDYSDKSLSRLEQLLSAIRERAKPSREALQETPKGRNFCSLLAYYLIEVVQRRTGASVDWLDRAAALRVFPAGTQLPDAPLTRLIANVPDQGAAFMPLGWIEARVLGEDQQTRVDDYVAGLVAQVERDGPVVWWTGMHAVGQLASWQMMMAADGGTVQPARLTSAAPKTFEMLMGADAKESLQRAGQAMEDNREGAAWQVLSYDGIADLRRGRVDAVMVMLYTYGASPLRLKIAFPYQPTQGSRRFAILDPTLLGANVEDAKISMLGGAMERGIQSIKWAFGTTWNQLRQAG